MNLEKATTTTVIPADGRWLYCDPISDESGVIVDIDETPVLAWAVTLDTVNGDASSVWVMPVIADDSLQANARHTILKRPDGVYTSQSDRYFESREEVIRYLNAERGGRNAEAGHD